MSQPRMQLGTRTLSVSKAICSGMYVLAITSITLADVVLGADSPLLRSSQQIVEIRTILEIYEQAKPHGVIEVELRLGDSIQRWTYGADTVWEVGSVSRFVQRVAIDPKGREPHVYISVGQRSGDGRFKTGIKAQVFLYF